MPSEWNSQPYWLSLDNKGVLGFEFLIWKTLWCFPFAHDERWKTSKQAGDGGRNLYRFLEKEAGIFTTAAKMLPIFFKLLPVEAICLPWRLAYHGNCVAIFTLENKNDCINHTPAHQWGASGRDQSGSSICSLASFN
ncbi:hypothetical protein ACTXT7_005736 [Hymenolepis weldensis]